MSAPERIWLHPSAMTIYVIPPETNTLVQFVRADIAASQLAEKEAEIERIHDLYGFEQRGRLAAEAERDRLAADLKNMTESRDGYVKDSVARAAECDRLAAENARLREVLDTVFEDIQARTKAGMSWGINGHPTLSPKSLHLIQQTRFSARSALSGKE